MIALAFDIKGSIAHFRKADTTATHMTYPFITPTAAKGLVGAILGITDFMTRDKIGIQLLKPVSTIAQQMSMLGKDSGNTFNRPTTIELIINPAYRIFYVGDEYSHELLERLKNEHSVYPTYLGSAYALTKPLLYNEYRDIKHIHPSSDYIETKTIIPTSIIEQLKFESEKEYTRAGGFMLHYMGERTFEKSISFIYERSGSAISFQLSKQYSTDDIDVMHLGDEVVCLF